MDSNPIPLVTLKIAIVNYKGRKTEKKMERGCAGRPEG